MSEMTDKNTDKPDGLSQAQANRKGQDKKKKVLGQALRSNLHRRKAQARARQDKTPN